VHRGSVRRGDHEGEDIDAEVVPLGPEGFGEDEVEGLRRAVRGQVNAAGPGRARGGEDDTAPAPADHRPAEAVGGLDDAEAVAPDQREVLVQVLVEERHADVVAAGVGDEQADLEVGGRGRELGDRLRRREVGDDGPHLDAVRGPDLGGEGTEDLGPPGEENEVEAAPGQSVGEGRADPVGSAGHDRPRSVALAEFGHS